MMITFSTILKIGMNKIINNDLKFKYKTMSSYCLKCKKNTMNINPKVLETNNGETMLLSKCAMCSSKKLRFIKTKRQVQYY